MRIKMEFNYTARFIVLACCLFSSHIKAEHIVVAGDWKAQPKNWINEHYKPEGIMIDILSEVSKRTGITFSYELSTWNRSLQTSKAGAAAIIGFSKTSEREKLWDYTVPMYHDEVVFVAQKKDAIVFKGLESLKGKRVAVKRGSTYGDDFDAAVSNGLLTLEGTEDRPGQMRMLALGRVDVVLLSPGNIALQAILAENDWLKKNKDRFEILEPAYKKDANYLGLPKSMNKSHLIPKINQALEAMLKDGTRAAIEKRNIDKFLLFLEDKQSL